MTQRLDHLKETASQTAGPYIHIGATPNFSGISGIYPEDLGKTMVARGAKGERITIVGHVIDGGGAALKDALVEIWQADAAGLYNSPQEKRGKADPNFTGFGRQPTDLKTGEYRFETIKPGSVPFVDGRPMAPHVTFWLIARGINLGLHTRMYFSDETAANAHLAEEDWNRGAPPSTQQSFSAEPSFSLRPTVSGVSVLVRYITRVTERHEVSTRIYHAAVELVRNAKLAEAATEPAAPLKPS